jgi:hypothetical protein
MNQLATSRQERYEYVRGEDVRDVLYKLEGDTPEIPFTSEADISILNKLLSET